MTMLQLLPVIAYVVAALAIMGMIAGAALTPRGRLIWLGGLSVLFAGFTAVTLAQEGVLQFWINHSTTFAGNQVWFDLLIAVCIAFYLILPRARAMGMPVTLWAVAVLATASVALLPMLARLLWLEAAQRRAAPR